MIYLRKTWLIGCALAIAGLASGSSWAQERYPNRPVRIYVALGPGSGIDALARFLAEHFRRDLQAEFIVENKAGAGGVVGGDFVAKSRPDGYTLAMFHASVVTTATVVNKNVAYDPVKDFTPIANLVTNPLALVVSAASKWETLEQLIEDAKNSPGRIACGIIGVGSHTHFNLELLKIASGAVLNRVPFAAGTGPVITALLGGHVDCTSLVWAAVIGQVKAGKFRPLAVTSRINEFPQIPTFASKGFPQVNLEVFNAMFGPANLPKEVMDRLTPTVEKLLKDPEVTEKLEKMGFSIQYEGPRQLGERVRHELAVVRDVAKKAGIKAE